VENTCSSVPKSRFAPLAAKARNLSSIMARPGAEAELDYWICG
jgi:hypothetical protein